MQFPDIAARLTTEAEQLFNHMVETHLAADKGHRFFLVHSTNVGTRMQFVGQSSVPFPDQLIDQPSLDDLRGYGLVRLQERRSRNTNYNLSGDAVRFHQWLRQHRGQPLASVEGAVRHLVGSEAFTAAHPRSAHHIEQAMALLWSESAIDSAVASELGLHLRSALIDLVTDLTGAASKPEDITGRLNGWLAEREKERESKAIASLVQLTVDTQWLNQRVTHIRDEIGRGRPPLSWEEMRRATFLTVVCCHELARV